MSAHPLPRPSSAEPRDRGRCSRERRRYDPRTGVAHITWLGSAFRSTLGLY
jgi:hypothetical protein